MKWRTVSGWGLLFVVSATAGTGLGYLIRSLRTREQVPVISCDFSNLRTSEEKDKRSLECMSQFVSGRRIFAFPPGTLLASSSIVQQTDTGLVWQRSVPFHMVNGSSAARAYCEGLELGGVKGWRLPTSEELSGLVMAKEFPTINGVAFPNTPSSEFWSSTPIGDGAVLGVDFGKGCFVPISIPNHPVYLRCVHDEWEARATSPSSPARAPGRR